MRDEVKKEQNGRDLKSKDRKSFNRNSSPNRRNRSRSPVDRKKKYKYK